MKNVIKRGTSLLLVLAMLLSFAAVVGAEEPATPEKILTLTVENAVLHAGETKCLPVYETVKEGHSVDMVTLSAISDNKNVVVKGVYAGIPVEWTGKKWIYEEGKNTVLTNPRLTGMSSAAAPEDTPLLTWLGNDDSFTTSDLPLCYVQVTATADAAPGAYQINMTKDPNVQEKTLFSIVNPEGGPSITKTADDAILNPGTAVVIPATASLPTVILTKTAFEAPTQAGLSGADEVRGDYALTKYVKLVTDTGLVDVTDLSVTLEAVNGASLKSVSLKEVNGVKTLSLSTAAVKDAQYKLKVSSANGNTFAPEVELPFTVSKNPVFTMAGFTKNKSYATAADIVGSKSVDAPSYGATNPKIISFDPRAFDQYGVPLSKSQYTATTERHLYSDEACANEIATGNAVESVTVSGTGSLLISGNLQTDVWCKVRASATVNGEPKYSEWYKFQIKSKYPQPKKAIISLTDASGAASSNTIEIPAIGAPDKRITYAVTSFIDQNGTPMDKDTTPESYTVTFKVPTTTTVPGVECTNGTSGTITVKSTAASYAPITGTFTVMVEGKKIDAYLTDTTTPATLTIKKADPIASSLASMENGVSGYQKDKIFPVGSFPTELPGIRESDSVSVTLQDLRILDQYDELTMAVVPSTSFSLYRVDGEQEAPISGDYAQFHAVDNKVTLTLTNARLTSGDLALQPGTYKIKAQWNGLEASSAGFTLTQEDNTPIIGAKPEYNASTLDVPYKYGQPTTTPTTQVTVRAKFENKYGPTAVLGSNFVTTLSDITLNDKPIETGDTSITYTDNQAGSLTIAVNSSAAKYFGDKTEITLTAKMTATYGTGENDKVENIPISITLRKDASALSAVYIGMDTKPDLEMPKWTWNVNVGDSEKETTVNLTSPETETKYYFDIKYFDQYGVETTSTFGMSGEPDKLIWTSGPVLTVKPNAEGTATLDIPGTNKEYRFNVKFAKMGFVNGDGADYKVDMMLKTDERTYGQDNALTWSQVYDKIQKQGYPKVFIKGENNQLGGEVTDKVKVVVKDNKNNVVFDSFKTYTEAPKANAGTYTIELVYVKTEGEGETATTTFYPIDNTTFEITPKEVTITINPPAETAAEIKKEYDGTTDLPTSGLYLMPDGVVTGDGVSVDPAMLEFAQANAGENIAIQLKEAGTNCLKLGYGTNQESEATNYVVKFAKDSTQTLYNLTGTITPRKLIITPHSSEQVDLTYGDNVAEKLASEYTTNINELPTTCVKPTIEGSMALTKGETEASAPYNAGEYTVALGSLSLTGTSAGNYQLELASGTHTWTINRKLLTKVKNSGLPSSGFGANTDEGCISHLLTMSATDKDGMPIGILAVSDFVDASALSFPSNTVYVMGQNGTKYPVPKTYTLTATDKPTKDIGKNYRVDETTVYEFDYTVNKPDASLLTVTLTEDTYTYNGMEQGPTVSVTYKNQANDTLDLTSCCTIGGTTKATDAGTYTITVTSDLLSVSKTVTWKINPKTITKDMFSQKTPHPVYDGKEQTLTGSVLDGKDSGIKVNGENKVLKLGTDFTAAEVKQTNAGEYTMTVTGQGNYTGTADVKVKIDKYKGRVYTEIDKLQNTTVEVTRGQSVEYEILTDVVLHEQELVATLENEKIGKIGYQIHGAGWNMAGIENPRIEVTGDKKLLFKATVTNQVEVGREFHITFENSLDNENIKSRSLLTISFVVTEKPEQKDFRIVEGSEGTYSYSQGGLQLTTTGSAKGSTVSWSSSNTEFATVDNNGKVTFVKPTTTAGVIITATASETSAPNALFKATERTYRLTITKGQVTITASSATMTANDPLPGFSATASGLNPNDSVSEVFQTLTASAGTDGKTAGTFRVMPNATFKTGGRKNWSECYDLYFVAGTLTVNPAQTAIDVVLPIIIGGNTCANGYANCACESFYDLDASRWYHEAIDWAYSLGLMNGTTKSTFGPNAAATRAQTWTMLARIAGQDTRRSSTWYEVGQKWAMNLGITDGTNPMGSLTREQLAAMLYRYVGSPAVNGTLTFTDSANVSAWARNAMIWAVQNGILDGVGGNRLNPKGTTTRAQAAAIFMRFSKLINK